MTLPTSADLQGLDLLLRLGRVRDAIVRARPDMASVVDVLHGSALMLALPPPRDGQHVVVAPSRTGKVVVWLVVFTAMFLHIADTVFRNAPRRQGEKATGSG